MLAAACRGALRRAWRARTASSGNAAARHQAHWAGVSSPLCPRLPRPVWSSPVPLSSAARLFSNDGGGLGSEDECAAGGVDSGQQQQGSGAGSNGGGPVVPATQTVPDVWPVVPVIAVNKHPVFPKFIKVRTSVAIIPKKWGFQNEGNPKRVSHSGYTKWGYTKGSFPKG